jgi:hypothetical protein
MNAKEKRTISGVIGFVVILAFWIRVRVGKYLLKGKAIS